MTLSVDRTVDRTPDRIGDRSDALWTQKQAAAFLAVTPRYLRDSSCPKILLPGNGAKGHPLVRYDPDEVRRWAHAWRAGAGSIRRAS